MRKLFYMGLEPYQARYTLQLQAWNEAVFKQRGIDYTIIEGDCLDTDDQIVTGSVLDAHGRSYYSLTQTATLVKLMQQGEITSDDVIFYEDMFTPGLESLPYILDQSPPEYRPKVFMRCLAQSIDPDDFVNREGMLEWMRCYEKLADNFLSGIICASEEMVANLRIAGFKCPLYVSGLPFGKAEVASRVPKVNPIHNRPDRVAFAARWDDEKQPNFYMDLAEAFYKVMPEVEFAILCGHPDLKSNRKEYVDRAKQLESGQTANFKVYTGLQKDQYYNILANSQVMFNCALQDWVSNTVSEADTFGTLTLYPAYRSFPEVFGNDPNHLYIPWSLVDAQRKLKDMIDCARYGNLTLYKVGKISDWQDGTISRTLDILEGNGEQWSRNTLDYRRNVATRKW